MPHQPQRDSVRFRQKPRASALRLILRKDYVELKFQFLTLACGSVKKPRASAQRPIFRKDYVERNFQFLTLAQKRVRADTGRWLLCSGSRRAVFTKVVPGIAACGSGTKTV